MDVGVYCPRQVCPDDGGLCSCIGADCALWNAGRNQCGDLTSAQSLAAIADAMRRRY
jgi:hypothetical protein